MFQAKDGNAESSRLLRGECVSNTIGDEELKKSRERGESVAKFTFPTGGGYVICHLA